MPLTALNFWQTNSLASRQEVLENVRFVRERAAEGPGVARPFNLLNLHEAPLANLSLGCAEEVPDVRDCADFVQADLSGAILIVADLKGADFTEADLRRADFFSADLSHAMFSAADLTGANFTGANLTGAYLGDAVVADTDFSSACHDTTTVWPPGFLPPPPSCPSGRWGPP